MGYTPFLPYFPKEIIAGAWNVGLFLKINIHKTKLFRKPLRPLKIVCQRPMKVASYVTFFLKTFYNIEMGK